VARKLARGSEPEPEPELDPEEPDEEVEEVYVPIGTTVEPLLYNVDDACFMLGKISKPMLFRLITKKKITPIKLGSRSMFTKAELERYIRECQQAG